MAFFVLSPGCSVMAYNYIVSAQKPTATNYAVCGCFTGVNDVNLLVAKYNRVEVYLVTSEGLTQLHDVGFYGRIAAIHLFRPQSQDRDFLLLCTERNQFAILSYNNVTKQIVTEAAGTTRNDAGRLAPNGQISDVDPDGRMFFVHQYIGMMKIVPLDKNCRVQEPFNVRLEELNIVSIKFLHNCVRPTIVVLYQDSKDVRHLKTYEVNTIENKLVEGPWSMPNIVSDTMLVPVPAPLGGVIAVGYQSITFKNAASTISLAIPATESTFCDYIDGCFFSSRTL